MADQKQQVQQRQAKNVRVASYHETYANNVNLRMSNWDFFLEFGRIASITEKEIEIHSEVGVYISPQQAKILLKVFADNLAQYEKSFGVITIEPK